MEELEQVVGGNILTDAWDWVCEKAKETVSDPLGFKYQHPPFAPEIINPPPIFPELTVDFDQ